MLGQIPPTDQAAPSAAAQPCRLHSCQQHRRPRLQRTSCTPARAQERDNSCSTGRPCAASLGAWVGSPYASCAGEQTFLTSEHPADVCEKQAAVCSRSIALLCVSKALYVAGRKGGQFCSTPHLGSRAGCVSTWAASPGGAEQPQRQDTSYGGRGAAAFHSSLQPRRAQGAEQAGEYPVSCPVML